MTSGRGERSYAMADPAERFSGAELARRMDLTRALMAERSLDALLVLGDARHGGVCWLTEYRPLQACHLVVPRDGEPTLLIPWLNHVPNARELSAVPVAWSGEPPVGRVAEALGGARRIGLVGGIPYQAHARLRELLGDAELTDVGHDFAELQRVKSEEEIDAMREAARLTDLALAAIVEHARPGVSERELVARAELAYRLEGGDVGITFLRSMPMDAPSGIVPAQRPSGRRLARGDAIVCELTAVHRGYSGQVLWPVFVGAEPTAEWQRLFDAAHAAYRGMADTIRAGSTVADAIAAAASIRAAGYTICDDLLHGIGIGIAEPFVEPDDLERPPADGGMRFEAGMAVVLQPNPITPDERVGIQLGAAVVVRDDGVEPLHAVPDGPLIAA